MPDRIDEVIHRLDRMESRQIEQVEGLARFQGEVASRCIDHQRQLEAQQDQITEIKRRPSNGSGVSARVIVALVAAVTALSAAVSALIAHASGGR